MAEKKIHTPGTLPPTGVPGAPESQVVTAYRVACDGDGGGAGTGHPRVWLSIPEDRGWVECGYCDKRFIHADNAGDAELDLPGREGVGAHPGVPD